MASIRDVFPADEWPTKATLRAEARSEAIRWSSELERGCLDEEKERHPTAAPSDLASRARTTAPCHPERWRRSGAREDRAPNRSLEPENDAAARHRCSASHPLWTTISTRRLRALPALSSLAAIGWYCPWPATTQRSSGTLHSSTRK